MTALETMNSLWNHCHDSYTGWRRSSTATGATTAFWNKDRRHTATWKRNDERQLRARATGMMNDSYWNHWNNEQQLLWPLERQPLVLEPLERRMTAPWEPLQESRTTATGATEATEATGATIDSYWRHWNWNYSHYNWRLGPIDSCWSHHGGTTATFFPPTVLTTGSKLLIVDARILLSTKITRVLAGI